MKIATESGDIEIDDSTFSRFDEAGTALSVSVQEMLYRGIRWLKPLMGMPTRDSAGAGETAIPIEILKQDLARRKFRNQEIRVAGTFFPAFLLYSGWWEKRQESVAAIPNLSGLQTWLFEGFKSWGPSWDLNDLENGAQVKSMVGQIAGQDEADSLPVILRGHVTEPVQDMLAKGIRPFRAVISGSLTVAEKGDMRKVLPDGAKNFQYCINVNPDNKKHGVFPIPEKVDMYSGYLWQCWARKDKLVESQNPAIENVYFVWEHTDFTKPDAVEYNLDSLRHKAEYIRKKAGDLVLLQKSSSLIPGQAMYAHKDFRDFLWGK